MIQCLWSDAYHVETGMISTQKAQGVVRRAEAAGLIRVSEPEDQMVIGRWPGGPVDQFRSSVSTVHDPKYAEAVLTGFPRSLAESQGFDWSPALPVALRRIWFGQLEAMRKARFFRTAVLHPVSGAHHAHYLRGSGFCTFNFIIGAIAAYRTGYPVLRVAIVDLDAHQGDGTRAMLQMHGSLKGVHLFDISGSYFRDRHGVDGSHVIREVTNAVQYFKALDQLPRFLRRTKPDLVIYQAGVDPFEGDHVGGIDGMTAAKLRDRDQFVFGAVRDTLSCPAMVVNFAGGYSDRVQDLHYQTIEAMVEAYAVHDAAVTEGVK